MLVLPNSAVKRAEAEADARSLSYETMMENAGTQLAAVLEAHLSDGYCLIVCGKGRNAGDGYVAARILSQNGRNAVVAELYPDGYDKLTQIMRSRLPGSVKILPAYRDYTAFSASAVNAQVICDAVFGTGFRGELSGICAQAVNTVNRSCAYRVAADIPSGLSENGGLYFHADETVSMLCLKDMHALKPTSACCGKIIIADIGIKEEYISNLPGAYELVTQADAVRLLPVRKQTSHKGTFGHALIAAGSYRMPGAAVLASAAALRSGAGLVTCAFPDSAYSAVAPQIPESILMPLESDEDGAFSEGAAAELAHVCGKYSAIAVGCGITTGKGAEAAVGGLIENYGGTLIIDADGINLVSRNIDILRHRAGQTVLTPHPGEMSRLTGLSVESIEKDRFACARGFASEYGVTLLLKGHNTLVVSPSGETRLVTSGTDALSRGGAGDMLTGIAVSLCAYMDNVFDAVSLAAYIHGRAGFLAGEGSCSYSCAVGDIAKEYIGKAIGELCRLK